MSPAVDLATGEEIMVLADQLFPMASTSKIAIAANVPRNGRVKAVIR